MEYRIERVSITKMMYGWSKYGGAFHGLVKQGGNWFCQICQEEQPDSFPAYMLNIDGNGYREFLRLCANCENYYKKHIKEIKNYYDLIEKLRDKHNWY